MNAFTYLCFLTLVSTVSALVDAGPTNRFYSIPFFFGPRVKDWNNTLSYYDDDAVLFFWGYSWNIDYKGNLWVVDKYKHSIYYISKEHETWNAIFKVSGTEGVPGMQDGNIAMGTFNMPSSIAIWDNNPDLRRLYDNLTLIQLHDKFFDPNADFETLKVYNDCMKWVNRPIETLPKCGFIRDREFKPPSDDELAGLNDEEKEEATMRAYLEWGRVDYRKIKLVNLSPPPRTFEHDENIDPRIAYVADSGNHCVRRVVVKLKNVDVFAGLCGEKGFKDGLFGQNRLDNPEMVGVDHNGTVFIYDANNYYIRIVDPATKFMKTMMHGGCRRDYNSHEPMTVIPFQLELRGMICFKKWIKTFGDPTDHLVRIPKVLEILEPDAVLTGYEGPSTTDDDDKKEEQPEEEEKKEEDKGDDAEGEGGEDGEGDEEGDENADVSEEELKCYEYHHRMCPYYPEHPFIKEKEYYDFRDEYLEKVIERTKENAQKAFDENTGEIIMKDGKLKQRVDPKKDPYFNEKVKMCTVTVDTEELKSDGKPVQKTTLRFCGIEEKCCGVQDNDQKGKPIDQGVCCNKDD